MVSGTEYGIYILGLIGCVIFAVVATVIGTIRKKKRTLFFQSSPHDENDH